MYSIIHVLLKYFFNRVYTILNVDELFTGDKQQQPSLVISPGPPTSSANINTLKSLAPPSSQLNCHIKPSKDEDSAAAAAAAAYNQQNAICT